MRVAGAVLTAAVEPRWLEFSYPTDLLLLPSVLPEPVVTLKAAASFYSVHTEDLLQMVVSSRGALCVSPQAGSPSMVFWAASQRLGSKPDRGAAEPRGAVLDQILPQVLQSHRALGSGPFPRCPLQPPRDLTSCGRQSLGLSQ